VQSLYASDFDKVKCLEVSLQVGQTIYIPAYWWYSIRFGKNSSISCFRYRTYMNNVAVLPYIGLHALQIQNVKRNTTKKVSINELNNEVITIENTNVSNEVPNEEKTTTKIDDLPSYTKEETNNNQQI
jgi:hypothetical protein